MTENQAHRNQAQGFLFPATTTVGILKCRLLPYYNCEGRSSYD